MQTTTRNRRSTLPHDRTRPTALALPLACLAAALLSSGCISATMAQLAAARAQTSAAQAGLDRQQHAMNRGEQKAKEMFAAAKEAQKAREAKARKRVEERAQARIAQLESQPVAKVAVESILAGMVAIPDESYKMGRTEVTQAQWEAIMGANPSKYKGADLPVEKVSWNDCQVFLIVLNSLPAVKESGLVFRLPFSAEWEYACRAGADEWPKGKIKDPDVYCLLADGTEITEDEMDRVAWCGEPYDPASAMTHPVGQKEPNAYGLFDMLGTVDEWIQEKWGDVDSTVKSTYEEEKGGSMGALAALSDDEDAMETVEGAVEMTVKMYNKRVGRGGCSFMGADNLHGWTPDEPSQTQFWRGFRLCASEKAE
jgi:formylglycine-generating enzyme required for sulfatase activity